MGFLKRLRSKSRLRDNQSRVGPSHPPLPPLRFGPDLTKRLPDQVVAKIFSFVCPHTVDYSYESCEKSQIGDGCMLCDLRDLAHAAQACRKWYAVARTLLYTSIRIDAVHYCELEEVLAEKRSKAAKAFKPKTSVHAGDVPNIRLSLLCQTLRDQPNLGALTLFLKIPYMTRETAKADLARTISACPNLRYVDLPDGFFSGDHSCFALRQELQVRCRDIRKMTYRAGSEDALELLTHRHWPSIEVLELSGLAVELTTLRPVLASLPKLRELTLTELPWMDDTIFQSFPGQLPDFPTVRTLKLNQIPNVSAQGLQDWLQAAHVREELTALTLHQTGVTVPELHKVLWSASELRSCTILDTVSRPLALSHQLPPLASISLKTLNFEISNSEDVHGLQKPTESYYLYLANSLHQNALPALSTLYVRDQSFPELLILPPVASPFANGASKGAGSPMTGGGFNQTLEVFSKGIDELEWVFTAISPLGSGDTRRASLSGGRPLSAYSASRGLGPQWAQGGFGGEARRSVMVGNGFGGFLAVPQEEVPRPLTADSVGGTQFSGMQGSHDSFFFRPPPVLGGENHAKRSSRHDLWR